LELSPHHKRWLLRTAERTAEDAANELPGWLRPHRGEQRWSVLLVVILAIVLQVLLPSDLILGPRAIVPGIEAALCLILLIADPGEIHKSSQRMRRFSLLLIAVLAITNTASTIELVHVIVTGEHVSAVKILASGAAIWITNIIAFALWYWEFDRGGPLARALHPRPRPDFLFPQMSDERIDPGWHATFFDYLYVSFTNASAFSPTDTMPITRWAKMLMMAQSLISLVTVALVAARAVNVLPLH
jgi:uncharacterized membrane protein